MGTNALNTFVLRVKHPYVVGKLETSMDVGEPCREKCMLQIAAANHSACFSFSAGNHSRKLHVKHSIRTVAH